MTSAKAMCCSWSLMRGTCQMGVHQSFAQFSICWTIGMHNCKDIGYWLQLMHFDSDLPYNTPTLLIDFDHTEVIQGKREQSAQCQTVVHCWYLILWAWLMAHQGTPHLHGPGSRCRSSSCCQWEIVLPVWFASTFRQGLSALWGKIARMPWVISAAGGRPRWASLHP